MGVTILVAPFFQNYRPRVLVAEDNDMNRKILSKILLLHYDCLLAQDGVQALEIYKQQQPIHAVLMDIKMPNMDGLQVIQAIRRIESEQGGARVPIIAVSAFAQEEDIMRALTLGADAYITKPYKKEAIYAALHAQLMGVEPGVLALRG